MTKLEQAARQALDALEAEFYDDVKQSKLSKAITALRDALAEPVSQEPVGYFAYDEEQQCWDQVIGKNSDDAVALYAAHVRTKDLTDDEIAMCMGKDLWNVYKNEVDFARAVIAADREKNK